MVPEAGAAISLFQLIESGPNGGIGILLLRQLGDLGSKQGDADIGVVDLPERFLDLLEGVERQLPRLPIGVREELEGIAKSLGGDSGLVVRLDCLGIGDCITEGEQAAYLRLEDTAGLGCPLLLLVD